jgi:CubicO group peptidase (beta-lactamase class C family)
MNIHKTATKIILLFVLFQGCSLLSPEVEVISDLDTEINKIMTDNKIPSVSACIIKNDSIVWQKYYGYADYGNHVLTNIETIYELASVSKLTVVTAVMQLRELGLIDLNSDINNYLPFNVRNPNYPEAKITPMHLLTHASGLAWPVDDFEVPGIYDYHPFDSAPPLSEWLPQYLLPNGIHYNSAVWKNTLPGKRELYSNIGTALLGYLVEVITGIDFNIYCKQNIFEPLEMINTSYAYSDLVMERVAIIYWENYAIIGYYRQLHYPAHSLKSTLEDFSHFIIAYMNDGRYKNSRILNENTVNEILTIQNPASGICLIWDCNIGNWYGHTGGEPGISTCAEFQRDNKIGILIFSNKRNKFVYPGNRIHACIQGEANKYR